MNDSTSLRNYPLCWPDGWKRIPPSGRKEGKFFTANKAPTVPQGVERVMVELTRLGIRRDDLIISTNVPTRLDGLPRGDQSNPADPGVAVYWRKSQNAPMKCMAIDRYRGVADNLCAIAATLEAMRAIERHGGAEILDRAFTGFAALPASTGTRPWREVLGFTVFDSSVTRAKIEEHFRERALSVHPDLNGGSHDAMAELNQARADALAEVPA